jgi:hypothetical protein
MISKINIFQLISHIVQTSNLVPKYLTTNRLLTQNIIE